MMFSDDLHTVKARSGKTLLIIDDEISFVEVTKILLEMAGYTVYTAYDGLEGIDKFKENQNDIDLIICDLNMPKLGGHNAAHTFLSLRPTIKILMISGSIMEEDVPKYLVPHKVEFLRKPFLTETLLAILERLLA